MRIMIKKSVADEICRRWGLPLVKSVSKRVATSMPAEASPKLTSETAATHKRSIPQGKQNASRKSLLPRLVLPKGAARDVCKGNTHHDARGRFAAGGEGVPTGRGDFGDIYDCFKGKPNEAVKFLLEKKDGEAVGALHHKDVGDIDLVYGKEGTGDSDGYGLAKLARFHPEVLDDLQGILDGTEIVSQSENRIVLESEKHRASVRLDWNGKSKQWLLTAYEKGGGVSDSTTDIARTETSRKNDTPTLANTTKGSIAQNDKNATKKSVWSPQLVVKKSVACEICKANPHHDVRGRFASVDVAHAGEYVLTRSGSKDFGEITQEIANSIGRQAGKIRLRRGIEHERDKKGGYGEKHIEREGRKQQLEKAGYASARDFVEDVCSNFNKVYQNGGGLLLVKETGRLVCAIGLESSKDGNFYDVKTAHIAREGYYKKKRLLWESPSNLHKSESSKAPTLKSSYATPRAFSEYPDAHMIPQPPKNASEISKKISKNHPCFMVKKSVADAICRQWGLPLVQKSNPHHDARGRFASYVGEGASQKNLSDYIETILNGTAAEKRKLAMTYFQMAKTPQELKAIGLTGDSFTVRYGVISRHKGKDEAHNLSADEWKTICKRLENADNLVVAKHGEGFSVFVALPDTTMVGVAVKNAGKSVEVNSVSTVYKREIKEAEEIVYPVGNKRSPEQSALLNRQKLSISASDDLDNSVSQSTKKASEKSAHPRFMVRKSVARLVVRK